MASENQESVNSNGWQWRHIGMSDTLHIQRCRRLYSMEGKKHDLALFFTKNQFYAMEAWCSHMGKLPFDFKLSINYSSLSTTVIQIILYRIRMSQKCHFNVVFSVCICLW